MSKANDTNCTSVLAQPVIATHHPRGITAYTVQLTLHAPHTPLVQGQEPIL